jgi:hypothetical protein
VPISSILVFFIIEVRRTAWREKLARPFVLRQSNPGRYFRTSCGPAPPDLSRDYWESSACAARLAALGVFKVDAALLYVPAALASTDLILNGVFERHPSRRYICV